MHYPFWYVPGLTSPMLIAGIAVFHVLVSFYAVGGGWFLAFETRHAYRSRNTEYLEYLRSHAWFFVLLTVAYGAITGVGIWWTIGLASPLPTEYLIHTFVFGWAIEWVSFIVEIVSAFVFFYGWGKLAPDIHQKIGWIYAWAAWISLVIITAVTAFMLRPGDWSGSFWLAVLNPQTLPQVLARTGACLLMTTLYVYLHATFRVQSQSLRDLVARRSAVPAMAGAALISAGGLWWLLALPKSAQYVIQSASALNVMMGLVFALTVIVFFMFYIGPYRNPGWLSPGFAVVLFLLGFMVTGATEFIREAVRKPFVIYGEVYSNNVYPHEVAEMRRQGLLAYGVWTRRHLASVAPDVLDSMGRVDDVRLAALSPDQQVRIGQAVFTNHCGSCHAVQGYSGMKEQLRGWDRETIMRLVQRPESFRFFMPPFAGSPGEAAALTAYLDTLAEPHPIPHESLTGAALPHAAPQLSRR